MTSSRTTFLLCSVLLSLGATAHAQSHEHHHGAHDAIHKAAPEVAGTASATQKQANAPYAGMQQRAIKALSPQQTADLRAGKGMSLALPAELNGYPGPAHVLELAKALGLNEEQERSTKALFAQMQAETAALGEAVIASEEALDRLFREKTVTAESVQQATIVAAQAHGRLRAAHLQSHLHMLKVLTPAQVHAYQTLRGYDTVSLQSPHPSR